MGFRFDDDTQLNTSFKIGNPEAGKNDLSVSTEIGKKGLQFGLAYNKSLISDDSSFDFMAGYEITIFSLRDMSGGVSLDYEANNIIGPTEHEAELSFNATKGNLTALFTAEADPFETQNSLALGGEVSYLLAQNNNHEITIGAEFEHHIASSESEARIGASWKF